MPHNQTSTRGGAEQNSLAVIKHSCCWFAALLEKVMSLTPAQIDLLPPEQKAQVIALQTQMVSLAPAFALPHTICPFVQMSHLCSMSINTSSCAMRRGSKGCWSDAPLQM